MKRAKRLIMAFGSKVPNFQRKKDNYCSLFNTSEEA